MKPKLILSFVLVLGGWLFPLQAQYSTLQGRVVDEQSAPLPYVTVRLVTADSVFVQGCTTDEAGVYKLEGVGQGDYLLFFSSIGYAPQTLPFRQENQDSTLPDVVMPGGSVDLQEVEVKAQSVVHLEDRMMIIPDKQQVRHSYTGYDLLDNLLIPGVDVDRQEGKVKNFRGEVTLYIDGRKADFREVQSLRPRDIERVEYFDAPTGKYATDVASINYVTKKYDTGGYVSADAKQTIGYLNGDYNASAKVAHKNTSFSVWGGHRMQRYGGQRVVSDETYLFPGYELGKHGETLDALSRTNRQYLQANVEHRTDRRTLMAKAGFTRNATPEEWQASRTVYSHHPDETLDTYSKQSQTAMMPNMQLYGSFKIKDNQTLEANLNGSYSNTLYERRYDEGTFRSCTQADEDYFNLFGSLNYVLQMRNKHSLAVQGYHFFYDTSTDYTGDYDWHSHIRSNESLLFLEYGLPLGDKVSLRIGPGLSSLVYRTDDGQRRYALSPRLHFNTFVKPTDKQSINLSLSVGNSTPQYNLLNSVEQNVDSIRVMRGNPDLDVTKMYSAFLAYNLQAGAFGVSAFGVYVLNQNMPLMYYFPERGKIVTSYRSDNLLHMASAGASLSWKAAQGLHLKLEGYYWQVQATGGMHNGFKFFSGTARVNYYWKSLGVNAFVYAPSLEMGGLDLSYTKRPVNYGLSVNWSYRNVWIEAGTNAPFSKDLARRTYLESSPEAYRFVKTTHDRTYQQMGWVKVAYTFDFGRKTARAKTDAGADIQSTILKAD